VLERWLEKPDDPPLVYPQELEQGSLGIPPFISLDGQGSPLEAHLEGGWPPR